MDGDLFAPHLYHNFGLADPPKYNGVGSYFHEDDKAVAAEIGVCCFLGVSNWSYPVTVLGEIMHGTGIRGFSISS
ncbi:hypothetical protein L6452_05088 [Arctium lappa]|uniref:Uncharacterized protein n=1 Tax=Arctium lappa TaxID=4217 RepID=A0ACB9EG21_ARCLA|nr:hypothetical protein L6452_05088 [Arctium lappa]